MFVPDSGQQTILYYNPENPHMIYVPAENQMSVSMILKIMNNIYIPHLKWEPRQSQSVTQSIKKLLCYLQTRLHSLLKHILLDVLVTGVLFVLMHFPFRMVAYDMSFWEIISNVRYIADQFITHLILAYIRIKSDSLYGAILPHWVSDFAYRIVIHIQKVKL